MGEERQVEDASRQPVRPLAADRVLQEAGGAGLFGDGGGVGVGEADAVIAQHRLDVAAVSRIDQGDVQAANELLPLVYDEKKSVAGRLTKPYLKFYTTKNGKRTNIDFVNDTDDGLTLTLSSEDLPPQLRDAKLPELLGKKLLFQLKGVGLLEETDWNTKNKRLVFYCPEVQTLTVDGAATSVTDEATYQFEDLQLNGVSFKLKSARPGTISISGELVSITLD